MSAKITLGSVSAPHWQRGVNLIEIMVAMTIGLFLVLGATTLYVNTKKTSDVDDAIARLQETARYAMSAIETDVRMSNYWGQFKDSSKVDGKASQLLPAGSANALAVGTGADDCGAAYIDPEAYISATNNNYNLDCPANSAEVASADTLTVRRANTAAVPLSTTRFQLCTTRNSGKVTLGADPECPTTNVEYHNLVVNGYYVDQQSDQNPNYPALRRWTLIDGPTFSDVEIIPGVEDMQIELGWDNTDDRTQRPKAVRYVQPENAVLTNAAGFPNMRIVSVRVWLLIRAEQADNTFTDDRTYVYGDRLVANGTVNDLSDAAAPGAAYAPGDNFRRVLVSRTFFIRNVTGNY